MRKWAREIFLGVRSLISLYFLLVSLLLEPYQRGLVITLTVIYFSLSLAVYAFFYRLKVVNRLIDPVFLPVTSIMSGEPLSIYGAIPAISLHAVRNTGVSLFIMGASVLLLFYFNPDEPMHLLMGTSLLVAVFIGSIIPDVTFNVRKERENIIRLKSLYKKLLKDFAKWERERRDLELTKFLIDASLESPTVEDFLRKVKRKFGLRSIRIIPKPNLEGYEVLMDREKGLLSVPVKLDKGNAVIIFELESPFQLNDELVVSSLEKAGRMVALYIEGFSETSLVGKATSIS